MGDEKTTTIISMYGGPGAGKSTSAAYLYYLLKAAGESVELVREYVKAWAWEGRKINNYDAIYFLGKQVRHESMLFGKVKWIVTDSPIFMNLYYATLYCTPTITEGVKSAVLSFNKQTIEDGHKHHHVMLHRAHQYDPDGRYQTEAEALGIDVGVEKMLTDLNIDMFHCESSEDALKLMFEVIVRKK